MRLRAANSRRWRRIPAWKEIRTRIEKLERGEQDRLRLVIFGFFRSAKSKTRGCRVGGRRAGGREARPRQRRKNLQRAMKCF